jgi:hypothetical protein
MLVDKAARISSVQLDQGQQADDGLVFWTELRASEKGRSVVCSKKIGYSQDLDILSFFHI